jgi:hypothetical protein
VPLDFTSASNLFTGTEDELARALDISIADLRAHRTQPQLVPSDLLVRMGRVLIERGRGMTRVGEMILEDHEPPDAHGP